MSEVLGVVQARMSSSRLLGKVLEPILGQPMILRQLERLTHCSSLSGIVVATSTDKQDDQLASVVQDAGWTVIRGPQDDVLARFVTVVEEQSAVAVARLTADCPLISPTVVDQVVRTYVSANVDYVSNTLEPTYPDGLDVEVVRTEALLRIAAESTDPHEREHVTLGLYRRPDQFRIQSFTDPAGRNHSNLRWTVDNPEDLVFVRNVYSALESTQPLFDYDDILRWLEHNPQLTRTSDDAPRNTALDGLDTGVMRHPGNRSGLNDDGNAR